MSRPAKDRAVDVYLDAIRLVEATLHRDMPSFNAVLQTTTAAPAEMVLALTGILANAAAQQDDPDQAIRDLRASFVAVAGQ